ncbi:MAG TPA: hypothetical protein VH933_08380 [Aestuariivirgaceae bacterium]|jgi:hypothetical protein
MAASWPGHRLAWKLAAAVLLIWLLLLFSIVRAAALDPHASGKMLAVFEPGMTQDVIFQRIVAAGGNPLRSTWLPFVWVVAGEEAGFAGRLKDQGAIGAYGELPFAPAVAGCFVYADAKIAQLMDLRP